MIFLCNFGAFRSGPRTMISVMRSVEERWRLGEWSGGPDLTPASTISEGGLGSVRQLAAEDNH